MSQLKHQATTTNPKEVVSRPEPEVMVKGERRQFSLAYKQRIVEEAAHCPAGEVGALLRREGLYGSHLSKWRREVAVKEAASRRPHKLFQEKPVAAEALAVRLREVESENATLRAQLIQAEAIMAAQKKLVQSFERCLIPSKPRPSC
jgi:transposase-like protein